MDVTLQAMAPTRMKLRVRRRDNAAGATSSTAATRATAPSSSSAGGARGPRGGRAAREEEGEETGGRRRRRNTTSRKKNAAAAGARPSNAPSNAANLRSMSGEDASPDSKCPICLDRFNNLSYLDCCLHRFCFNCIQEWSLNKAECPLCKQPFTSILHSVRAEDDFKEYTLRPPPPPPPPPGNLTVAAAERGGRGGGRGRRLTLRRRRRGGGRGGGAEEEDEGPGGDGRRATTTRRRRRGERGGGGEEWYLAPPVPALPASPPTPPIPPPLEEFFMDEQRRMILGEGGVRGGSFLEEGGLIFGGLPALDGATAAAVMGDARTWRRLVRRVATRRRLQREAWEGGGGGRGGAESETLAFRRALYRTGFRVRGVAGADSDRHHRPVTADSFRRNSAHLERLRPWLRRELTALYGAHASLVDVVQRIICARLGRHGLEDTPAVEDELRPFLLARTAHFLHELLSFARSPLDLERYDMQAVYDTPETEGDTDSSNNGSVISISEGEEEEAGGRGGGSSSHHDDDIIQTGSSSFLSQSAWDDDETPGPSFTSSSVAELCSHSPGLLSVSPPAPPPRKEGGANEEVEGAEVGRGRGDDDEEEEACEIVGYVKPMAERTPELVQLSSDTEEEEQDQKTLPPPSPLPELRLSPSPPSLPPPATSNADRERDRQTDGEKDRQTDGERDRQSCRHADGKGDGEREGGSHRDSERALDASSGSRARSHSSGVRDDSSSQRERNEQREKETSISELLSAAAHEREKRKKRKRQDICDKEEEGDDEERRGRERAFLPLSLPGVFSATSTPSPPRPARLRPASPWAPALSPEDLSHRHSSSCCSSSSSSPLSSPLPYLPLSPGCGHRCDDNNKPSGKRKYKSRHLDDSVKNDPTWRPGGASSGCRGDKRKERGLEERRRDRRKRRERGRTDRGESSRRSREERSPSVEIIYEGTLASSTPRSPSNKRRRKRSRKPKHNSAPVIITINSDSSHDDDEDRYNNSSPLSGLSNHQPIDFVSKLPALPLAGPGSGGAAVDDLGINISELPVDIMDRASNKSDGEPGGQSKAVVDPVTFLDSEDDDDTDIEVDDEPAPPPNNESREEDVNTSVSQAASVRPQEKEKERDNRKKELNTRPKKRGGGGEGRSRERDGGMRHGERETEDGKKKDKPAVSADTHLLATILSDLEGLANPKLNLSPTFNPTNIPPHRNHTHQSSQGVNTDIPSSMEPRGRISPVDSHPRSHSSPLDFRSNSHSSPVDSDLRSHRSCAESHQRSHSSPLDSQPRSHSSAIDSHHRSHKSRGESDPRSHSSAVHLQRTSHSSAIDSDPRSHKSHVDSDPKSHSPSIDVHPRRHSSRVDSDPRSHKSRVGSDARSHKSRVDSDPRSHISSVDLHLRSHSSRVDSDPSSDRSLAVSQSPNSVLQQTSPSFSAPPKQQPPATASSDDDTDFCQLLEPLPANQKKADRKRKAVSSPPPLHRFSKNSPGEAKENGIDDVALTLTNRNTPPPLKHKDTKTQAFSPIPPLNVHSPLSESQSTSTDSVSVISPVDFPSNAAIFPIDSHCSSSSFLPKDSQPIPPISTLKKHFTYSLTSGHRSAVDFQPFSLERHSNSNTSTMGSAHTHSRRTHSDSSIDLHSSREESLTSSGSSSRVKTASSWMSPIHSPQLGTKSPIDLTRLAKTSPVNVPQLGKHSSHAPPRPYARSSHPPTRDGHPSLLYKSPIERRDHKHSYPGQPSSSPIEHKASRDSKLRFDSHWEPQLSVDSLCHSWTPIDSHSKSSPNTTVHIWPPIDSRSKSEPSNRVCIDSRSKSPPNDSVRIDSSSWPRVDSCSKSSPIKPDRIDSLSESPTNKPVPIDSISKSSPHEPVRIDTRSKSSPNVPERSAKPPIESHSKPLFPTDCQWESGPSIDSVTECPDKDNESKSSHCPSHSETLCDIEGRLVDRTVSPTEDKVCIEDTHTAM